MEVFHLGRAPRTKETLPDFLKWRRVTRHPLVFRGLTSSQRTPGFWGITSDLLSLLAGSTPPTKDPKAEALNMELALRASSVPSTSTSGDSSLALPVPGQDARGTRPARLPSPRKRIGSTPQVLKIIKKGRN